MNFLIDNPLATLYGPYFLILYGFVILFTLMFLGYAKSRTDRTEHLPTPAIPPNPDPFEIAYLRGGPNELARSAIFSLLNKNLIQIKTDSDKSRIIPINGPGPKPRGLPQIEDLTIRWIGGGREVDDVFAKNTGLVEHLAAPADVFHGRLESQHLLPNQRAEEEFTKWKWLAVSIILGLGSYKFATALFLGYSDVMFLVVFGFAGVIIAMWISKTPRITKRGQAYLERLQLAFDDLKYRSQAPYLRADSPRPQVDAAYAGVDPLMLSVGIFGGSILAGTIYDNYNQAFLRSQNQNTGGGCGAGCGSSCSSGDGGGGCGGCGGGD